MLTYQNQADIDHKYAGSVMYYDGKPCMIHGFKLGAIVYEPLGPNYTGGGGVTAKVNDDRFNEGPFRLGYVNGCDSFNAEGEDIKTVCFASRVPVRKWKQGLFDHNMDFRGIGRNMTFKKALALQGFVDMLTNTYPSLDKAWKKLDDTTKQVAYHRHWAVGINKLDQLELYYRGNLVGMGDNHRTLGPSPKYEYLQEVFNLSK